MEYLYSTDSLEDSQYSMFEFCKATYGTFSYHIAHEPSVRSEYGRQNQS